MAAFGDSVGFVPQESIGQTEITQRPRIIWVLVGFLFQAVSRLRERSVRLRRVRLKSSDQSFAEAARDEIVVGRSDLKRAPTKSELASEKGTANAECRRLRSAFSPQRHKALISLIFASSGFSLSTLSKPRSSHP